MQTILSLIVYLSFNTLILSKETGVHLLQFQGPRSILRLSALRKGTIYTVFENMR